MGTEMTLLPNPDNIANNLQSVATMIDELRDTPDEDQIKLAKQILRRTAANVRLLFELQADPQSGEFRLQNYGQAWMLADLMINADMVPSSYESTVEGVKRPDPAKVVIGLMKATEIGVSPISGLANIMIINNRPSVWGDLAQALVQRTGLITDHTVEEIGEKPAPGLELVKWDPGYGYRVGFSRKGQETPYVREYTVAKAKRSNLWGNTSKKPWITDPDAMLFNRARARSLRDGFSDCLFGMGIIEEQLDILSDTMQADQPLLPRSTPSGDDEPVTHQIEQRIEVPDYAERGEPETVETADKTVTIDKPKEGETLL